MRPGAARGAHGDSEQQQSAKAAKALAVLIPLLGVTYVLVIVGPTEGNASLYFDHVRALMLSSQVSGVMASDQCAVLAWRGAASAPNPHHHDDDGDGLAPAGPDCWGLSSERRRRRWRARGRRPAPPARRTAPHAGRARSFSLAARRLGRGRGQGGLPDPAPRRVADVPQTAAMPVWQPGQGGAGLANPPAAPLLTPTCRYRGPVAARQRPFPRQTAGQGGAGRPVRTEHGVWWLRRPP